MNVASPSFYREELNKMLMINNLPEITAPENSQSLDTPTKVQEAEDKKNEERETKKQQRGELLEEQIQEQPQAKTTREGRNENNTKMRRTNTIKAEEIGLIIYIPKSEGWPKRTLTKKNNMRNT